MSRVSPQPQPPHSTTTLYPVSVIQVRNHDILIFIGSFDVRNSARSNCVRSSISGSFPAYVCHIFFLCCGSCYQSHSFSFRFWWQNIAEWYRRCIHLSSARRVSWVSGFRVFVFKLTNSNFSIFPHADNFTEKDSNKPSFRCSALSVITSLKEVQSVCQRKCIRTLVFCAPVSAQRTFFFTVKKSSRRWYDMQTPFFFFFPFFYLYRRMRLVIPSFTD